MKKKSDPAARQLARSLTPIILVGATVIGVFFFALGAWASLAPLSSAAIATGVVSPHSSRKAIQHLEGGIIKEIRVRDGDQVTLGQPLVVLDNVQAKARHQANHSLWIRHRASQQRLLAQNSRAEELVFSDDVKKEAEFDPEFALFVKTELDLFNTKRKNYVETIRIYEKQIEQMKKQIESSKQEYETNSKQAELIKTELKDLEDLFKRGLSPRSRQLQLKRALNEFSGKASMARSKKDEAEIRIGEVQEKINNTETKYNTEVRSELQKAENEIAKLEQQKLSSSDILDRTYINAPVAGTVVNLRYETLGGVIKPGEVILDIVPAGDELIIDARISPIDIDVVRPGLVAQVHLLPYVQRYTPMLEGRVKTVSADSLVDESTRERYYTAEIAVDKSRLKTLSDEIELSPGMPAEVMIVTGERPAIMYILEPVIRSFRRSFREE